MNTIRLIWRFLKEWRISEIDGIITLSYKQLRISFSDKDFTLICKGNIVFRSDYVLVNCEEDFNPLDYNAQDLFTSQDRNVFETESICQRYDSKRVYQTLTRNY